MRNTLLSLTRLYFMNYHLCILIALMYSCNSKKTKIITFKEALKMETNIDEFARDYKSAIHIDTALSVFKDSNEIDKMNLAYDSFMNEFDRFLKLNDFKWRFKTRCFQKVLFDSDGTIEYIFYGFLGDAPFIPTPVEEKRFRLLLNKFVKNYKFPISAKTKFSQCSTNTFG